MRGLATRQFANLFRLYKQKKVAILSSVIAADCPGARFPAVDEIMAILRNPEFKSTAIVNIETVV